MTKFKLNYNPTYTFTLADIFDNSDSDIMFESKTRLEPEWAQLCQVWIEQDDHTLESSLEIVGMGISRVSQNGSSLDIDGPESAMDLYNAIEDSSPGSGKLFIEHLVLGHWNCHFVKMSERKKK